MVFPTTLEKSNNGKNIGFQLFFSMHSDFWLKSSLHVWHRSVRFFSGIQHLLSSCVQALLRRMGLRADSNNSSSYSTVLVLSCRQAPFIAFLSKSGLPGAALVRCCVVFVVVAADCEASVSSRSRTSSTTTVCFRLHSALTHSLRLGWSNVAAALNLLSSSSVLPPRLFRRHDHMCVHGEPTDKILIVNF